MAKKTLRFATFISATIICTSALASNAAAETKMATTEMLVNTCVACHGNQGVSTAPPFPHLPA